MGPALSLPFLALPSLGSVRLPLFQSSSSSHILISIYLLLSSVSALLHHAAVLPLVLPCVMLAASALPGTIREPLTITTDSSRKRQSFANPMRQPVSQLVSHMP